MLTRRLLIATLLIATLAAATLASAQVARWHRHAQSRLDPTTVIDVVKDTYTGRCYALYRVTTAGSDFRNQYVGQDVERVTLASLGDVPCTGVAK